MRNQKVDRNAARKAFVENEDIFRTLFENSADAKFLSEGEIFVERNHAEHDLKESENIFRDLTEKSFVGIYLVQDGLFKYVNPRFAEIFGYAIEELIEKKGPKNLVFHEDWALVEENLRKRLSGAEKWMHYTYRGITKGGQVIYLEVYGSRTEYKGQPAIIGSLADITQHKQVEQVLKESEERYRTAIENSNDGVAITQEGKHVYVNHKFLEVFGYSDPEEILNKCIAEATHIHPDDLERVVEMNRQRLRGVAVPLRYEHKSVHRDGRTIYVELSSARIMYQGKVASLSYMRDITERKRSEEALAASEERYRRVVESSPSAIFIDCSNHLVFVNPAATRLLGAVEPEQLRGRPLLDFVHVESKEIVQGHIDALLQGSQTFLLRDIQLTGLTGALLDVEITGIAFDYEGKPAVQLAVHDITDAKQKTVQLEHVASHDALTRLPNRIMMRDRLNEALAHARRYGLQATIVFLDLDHFKIINDSLGHDQGDVLLKIVADRLSCCVREVDTVARFGGDEFVIVLFDQPKDNDTFIGLLERIQKCVKQPVMLAGLEYSVSSSIGFAIYPRDGSDAETLLRNADEAMYRAKDQGRNNFQPYSEELHVHVSERLRLHNDLRRALERDEFIVYYQPQADLHSGRITAVEALVRWKHPDLGLMAPLQFIAAAEETGLITPIGEFVLRTACEQGKAWQDMGLPPLRVAVNLSSRQFWQPDLVEMVKRSLRDSGLDAAFLELELTESLILKGIDDAVRTMQALRTTGVELAIDDFGTGHSSLACLRRFPIGRLKIAQAFLHDIPVDPDSVAIARAVIALGHSLKLKVIAEGVETAQQLQFLEAAGCDEIQGYLISKPLPQEAITELLKIHLQRANVPGSQALFTNGVEKVLRREREENARRGG